MADEEKGQEAPTAQSVLADMAQEALDLTGGDVWRAGQPLASQGAPAEEKGSAEAPPAAEGSTPAPAKITVSDAEKVLLEELGPIAGKYNSIADLKKGMHELIAQRNALLEDKPPATTTPPETEAIDPLDELSTYGLPKDPIQRAVKAAVEHEISARQKAASEAQQVRADADRAIIEKYPDYEKRFDELTEFLRENPDLGRQVVEAERAGYHLLAREYAWLQFSRNVASATETDLKAKSEARKEERTARRADARTISPRQTEEPKLTPEQLEQGPKPLTKEEFERLKALAKEGYDKPLYRRVIGDWLPKDLFPDTV